MNLKFPRRTCRSTDRNFKFAAPDRFLADRFGQHARHEGVEGNALAGGYDFQLFVQAARRPLPPLPQRRRAWNIASQLAGCVLPFSDGVLHVRQRRLADRSRRNCSSCFSSAPRWSIGCSRRAARKHQLMNCSERHFLRSGATGVPDDCRVLEHSPIVRLIGARYCALQRFLSGASRVPSATCPRSTCADTMKRRTGRSSSTPSIGGSWLISASHCFIRQSLETVSQLHETLES